jgi:hypothetical protein
MAGLEVKETSTNVSIITTDAKTRTMMNIFSNTYIIILLRYVGRGDWENPENLKAGLEAADLLGAFFAKAAAASENKA